MTWENTPSTATPRNATNLNKGIFGDTQYGGSISSNFNTITKNGYYTGYGTATGAPNTSYSWFVHHQNSNTGTVSATQRAVAYKTNPLLIAERTKTSSTWGAWEYKISKDYITATAGSNGDFYINLGITPYTGMIINVSFPTATSATSNTRISINGGTNYYNTDTIASEVQNKSISFRYNGTSFEFIGLVTGSNINGSYTKYSDGKIICIGNGSKTGVNLSGSYGSFYWGSFSVSLPLTLTSVIDCNFGKAAIQAQMNWINGSSASTTSASCNIMDIAQRTNVTVDYSYIVTGKWK